MARWTQRSWPATSMTLPDSIAAAANSHGTSCARWCPATWSACSTSGPVGPTCRAIFCVRARASQLRLTVTATDVRSEIVDVARSRSVGVGNLEIVQAHVLTGLDFADHAFDVVHSSLLLHHLEPVELTAMLREMGRVARAGVIVNDLDRRRLWWLTAKALGTLATRNEYTRNDAPLSVARAYRPDELSALAADAGLREVKRRWARPPYRYGLALVAS